MQLASAALEGERRRAHRLATAADPSHARPRGPSGGAPPGEAAPSAGARPAAAPPVGPPAPGLPLSEAEREAERRRRADLALTWAVAAVVSAGLALAAYATGVPDIGLGSLLFIGLAGARTWWLRRRARRGSVGPFP